MGKLARFLAVAVAGVILILLLRGILFPPEDDETQIRRLVQTAASRFEAGSANGILRLLHDDFGETTTGWSRDEIGRGLRYLFRAERDRKTGELPFTVDVPDEGVEVLLGPEPDRATVALKSIFRDAAEEPIWEVSVEAGVARDDGGRWKFVESKHRTLSGRSPF